MAEAHSAVAFSFAITHEGVNVNFDLEVLHLVWESGVRSWKKRLARFKNGVKTGVYPAPLHSLSIVVSIFAVLYFSGFDITFGLVDRIVHFFPRLTFIWLLVSCAVSAFILWITCILMIRYTLKIILMYKGWLYEERGRGRKMSSATRLWFLLVKCFSGWSTPMLYSFQGSLPRLPLPPLKSTMARYLRSVQPLLDDTKYSRMESLANEFQDGIGKKLQRYLHLKSWWSSNYVSDWWEEYVYLRGRTPLMVNSNFYGMDAVFIHPTRVQTARAANIIYGALLFRRAIDRQELEPIRIQGLVPLCSWQYERVFNTCRVPGEETDTIVHYMDSTHIVVYHKGRYFKVIIHYKGRLLRPCEIEAQLEQIVSDASDPEKGEERLGALTADDRATWAKTRAKFFRKGANRVAIDAIEKSAFVLALDQVEYEYDAKDTSKLNFYGRMMLHGKGYDRWFDKSFTVVVGSNGKIGFNAEHSWADAPIMGHLWEFCLAEDIINGYKPDGHTNGEPEFEPPKPIRLKWDLPSGCLEAIDTSYQSALRLLNDVDLMLYVQDHYGKGFIKGCQVSPDAYIQMALQLAYFRDSARFSLTYEASMTRLFREGRTETVRPCTVESCEFVRSMERRDVPREEKVSLLQKACRVHQRAYQDAMCGKGIDRHLFCLYVVSKYLEVDSPFLREVLSEPWRLSTSQTPHGQTAKLDLFKHPDCISCGGGFGPVADDGYGVSYIIAGEDLMFFHISSKRSSPETDSSRFAKQLERAFQDMRALFFPKSEKKADGTGNNCHS